MMIIRPVNERDADGLETLNQLNWQGLTVLPGSTIAWRQKISQSLATFARESSAPKPQDLYLFVLEDLETKQLRGTCQLIGVTAGSATLGHYYHLETLDLPPASSIAKRNIPVLSPVKRPSAVTEAGGLFIDPSVRQLGLSGLASLSRFLFIASYPERFCSQIVAEIRGQIDEERNAPFWDAVGRHFWDIDYPDLIHNLARDPSLIAALLSPIPIYVFLLKPEIQAILGKAHFLSQIALKRLLDQGFIFSGDIDPFDGGPKVVAETKDLRVLREHQLLTVAKVTSLSDKENLALVANTTLDFRACMASVAVQDDQTVIIDQETAYALNVNVGDSLRVALKNKQAKST